MAEQKIKKTEQQSKATNHQQKTHYLGTIDYLYKKTLVIVVSVVLMCAICVSICFFTGCARRLLFTCRKKNRRLGVVVDI
jgi:hypothetical protein